MTRVPGIRLPCLALAILALVSCASMQYVSFEELTSGLKVSKVQANNHLLFVVYNEIRVKNRGDVNIYLEGDGRPWSSRFTVSSDPSPRYPLALELMRRDPGPAYYLTRPCYHRLETCSSKLWTSARYSQEVVDTMAQALEDVLASVYASSSETNVRLIGHSGGGALAMLIASQVTGVDEVITVAGNLDIDAWTELHNYSPLKHSLNPVDLPSAGGVRYLHLLGGKDENTPPTLGESLFVRPGHRKLLFESFDHSCCWVDQWREILKNNINAIDNNYY